MTEARSIGSRLFRGANEAAKLVTCAARRDVASARRLRAGSVTTETSYVRVHSRRNRQRHTTAAAPMTRRTISAGSGVFRVIEPDVETAQRWKRFHFSTLRVRVTDRTDLARSIRKLLLMTARTRRVRVFTRQRRLRCVVGPSMTEQTRQPRVIFVIVFELRVTGLSRSTLNTNAHSDTNQ